jgi:hypothetical protein
MLLYGLGKEVAYSFNTKGDKSIANNLFAGDTQ